MSNVRNRTAPVKPGLARVVCRPTADAPGLVVINGTSYSVALMNEGAGIRLMKACGVTYDMPADLSSCDCPDDTFRERPEGCKHRRALAALRAAGRLS